MRRRLHSQGLPFRRGRARRDGGITLIELIVAISILIILGWALAQLLWSGMATWREGEVRRGAYERAQFILDRLAHDLGSLYPHPPAMPDAWVFQVDSLFSDNSDGTGEEGVEFDSDNLSVVEESMVVPGGGDIKFLSPTDSGAPATVEYRFTLPTDARAAVVQPKIRLVRSDGSAPTCTVAVEYRWGGGAWQTAAEFTSGLRDQVITPHIDVSPASPADTAAVRLRILPEPGQQSDARLFEAGEDDPLRPVFRFAASPNRCCTEIALVSDYRSNGTQFLVFVRSTREGLEEVAYFVEDETLYRAQRDSVGGSGSLFAAQFSTANALQLASGIAYFGGEFLNQGEDGEEEAARQLYWREADSVPRYVRVRVATVPLSESDKTAHLREGVSSSSATLRVDSTRRFVLGDAERQYVKIGAEWIRYGGLERGRFTDCTRGQRGTLPAAHGAGAVVTGAETFWVDLPVPAWGYRKR